MKNLNRALFKAGIFVMRDNEQGKRYGRRSPDSRIVEAYGFDLSPLTQRQEEFIRIAAAANVERQCMKELRRRKTLAIRAIRQAAQELEVQGCEGQALHRFADDTAELAATARHAERSRDLGPIVEGLERRRAEAEGQLRALIKPVKPDSEGLVNEPRRHTTTTRENDLEKDTVVAWQKGSPTGESTPKTPPSGPKVPAERSNSKPVLPTLRVIPAQLVELAPRLERYIVRSEDALTWPDVVNGAEWLAGEFGISQVLWSHACLTMGRNLAAIALAFVTTQLDITPARSKRPKKASCTSIAPSGNCAQTNGAERIGREYSGTGDGPIRKAAESTGRQPGGITISGWALVYVRTILQQICSQQPLALTKFNLRLYYPEIALKASTVTDEFGEIAGDID